MNFDRQGLAANYTAAVVERAPDDVRVFAPESGAAPASDLNVVVNSTTRCVCVEPLRGAPWTGMFAGGLGGISALYATPNPDVLCVVEQGQGYWIPVLAPQDFEVIRCIPVKEVHLTPLRRHMVFVDFTGLVAYCADGFAWLTEDLSWDGLTIDDVGDEEIRGTGWDAPTDRRVPFSVNVRTGTTEGGSSPRHYQA